jgi:hypothetical protein
MVDGSPEGVLAGDEGFQFSNRSEERVPFSSITNHQCAFVAFGRQYSFEERQR